MGTASLSGDVDLQRRCWDVGGVGWARHGPMGFIGNLELGFKAAWAWLDLE
jgi:hypothetical protein